MFIVGHQIGSEVMIFLVSLSDDPNLVEFAKLFIKYKFLESYNSVVWGGGVLVDHPYLQPVLC